MNRDGVRREFPVLERLAYLNTGTFGPLARATHDAIRERAAGDLRLGRAGARYFEEVMELRDGVRGRIAGLVGAPADQVALTYSTSDACQLVVQGLGIGRGDEVITTDSEHFGLLGPLAASGADVRVVAPEADALAAAVGPRTRLVAVSQVLWTTGARLPLEELARRISVPLLVDGAQSVGAIDVDARAFDFLTISGQKWLCGPDATGALVVREPERLRIARPTYLAQESHEPTGTFVARAGAARFDSGWLPAASLAGLLAALDAAPPWRFEAIREAAAACRARLAGRFDVVTPAEAAGLVAFRIDRDTTAAVAELYGSGVVVREIPGRGLLRASCGYWTDDADLDRLVAALAG